MLFLFLGDCYFLKANGEDAPTTNVMVCVRVRPLLPAEKVNQCQKCVKVRRRGGASPKVVEWEGEVRRIILCQWMRSGTCHVNAFLLPPAFLLQVRGRTQEVLVGESPPLAFDLIFDDGASQEDVYQAAARPLVDGCFMGYNATVFAYGQTGSGKSYTMGSNVDIDTYSEEEKGIIPRVMKEIFYRVKQEEEQGDGGVSFSLKVGYVEVYNEEVRDLLQLTAAMGSQGKPPLAPPQAAVTVREDAKGNIVLVGAREEPVKSLEEVYTLLERGSALRTTGGTLMNEKSSR